MSNKLDYTKPLRPEQILKTQEFQLLPSDIEEINKRLEAEFLSQFSTAVVYEDLLKCYYKVADSFKVRNAIIREFTKAGWDVEFSPGAGAPAKFIFKIPTKPEVL
jgi:hypothetical protein